jgi:hypothetical protein
MKNFTMFSLLLSSLCLLSSNVYAEVNHETPAATVSPSDSNHSSYKAVSDATGTLADKPSSSTAEKKKHESICWTCHDQKQPSKTS